MTYNFLADGLYVTVPAAAGTPGDYNNNGRVDAADYVVWRKNEGTNNSLPNNSLPGPIGPAHYQQWRANFGNPPGAVLPSARPPFLSPLPGHSCLGPSLAGQYGVAVVAPD